MGLATIAIIVIIVLAIVMAPQRKRSKEMKEKYAEIKIGMSSEELVSLLGQPTSTGASADGKTIMKWEHTEFKGLAAGGNVARKITVELENNKAVSFVGDALNT